VVTAATPDEPRGKDAWDKFNIIAKGFLAIMIPGLIAGFGIYLESQQREIGERNRQAQAIVELVNSREHAMVNLRSEMFNSLLDKYLTGQDFESKIAVLEMIGLNFRDAIQIKPLFEHLDHQLSRTEKTMSGGAMIQGDVDFQSAPGHERDSLLVGVRLESGGPTPRDKLRRAAGRVIKDQLDQIREADSGSVCEMTLVRGEEAKRVECFPYLKLGLVAVTDSGIRVRPESTLENLPIDGRLAKNGFLVNYFDMPMIDYTFMDTVTDKIRYSIVLREASVDDASATIALAVLPATAVTKQNPYLFDELVGEFTGLYAGAESGTAR